MKWNKIFNKIIKANLQIILKMSKSNFSINRKQKNFLLLIGKIRVRDISPLNLKKLIKKLLII